MEKETQEFVFQGFAQSANVKKSKPLPAVVLRGMKNRDGSTSYSVELATSIWESLDVSGTGRALVTWNEDSILITSAPPELPTDAVAPVVKVRKGHETRSGFGIGRVVARTLHRPKAFPLDGRLEWMGSEVKNVKNVTMPVTEKFSAIGRPAGIVLPLHVKGLV